MMLSLSVLVTWALVLAWSVLVGGFAGVLAGRRVGALAGIRVAMWFGFAVIVLSLLVTNLFVPLVGGTAIGVMVIVTLLAVGALVVVWRRGGGGSAERSLGFAWWTLVPMAALALTLLFIAHSFAGPLTNYDSGVYHLQAIQFAAEYPTIPGLANFQDRLGTNISSFSVAAFLANLPWGIEAFRLLVGLFVSLFSADVVLRLLDRRATGRRQAGTIALLLSMLVAGPFLFGDPTHWVTSPTPDTISMLLTLVAGAYFVDAFVLPADGRTWAATAAVVAALAASVRTQLWVFAAFVVLGLLIRWWLGRRGRRDAFYGSPGLVWLAAAGVAALVVVQMVRDVILSGWLLFPASVVPLPVDWRVPDPAESRIWITSWARDPNGTPESTTGNWDWVGSWIGRSVDDWAVRGAIGMLALFVLVLLLRRSLQRPEPHVAAVHGLNWLLLLLPVAATAAVWFVAAPDPRFIWGVIALAGIIPAAVALSEVDADVVVPLVAGFAAAALLPAAVVGVANIRGMVAEGAELRTYSFGPLAVAAYVNPVPSNPLKEFTVGTGQVLVSPVDTETCWLAFPQCRPYPDPLLEFRGDRVEDGFRKGAAPAAS